MDHDVLSMCYYKCNALMPNARKRKKNRKKMDRYKNIFDRNIFSLLWFDGKMGEVVKIEKRLLRIFRFKCYISIITEEVNEYNFIIHNQYIFTKLLMNKNLIRG